MEASHTQYGATWVRLAGGIVSFKYPMFPGLGQFILKPQPLQKQAHSAGAKKRCCPIKQSGQRRKGAGRNHIEWPRPGSESFNPFIIDYARCSCLADHLAHEDAFALIALNQMHPEAGPLAQKNCNHEARKSAPGTEIGPTQSGLRRQACQLGRVEHMAPPKLIQSAVRDEVYSLLPLSQQGLV